MAAYKQAIIELVAIQLCADKGLQSPELRYEKAAFLEWLQDEMKFTSFKQVCLANGVELVDYNKYFADKAHECLRYILQEDVLRPTTLGFIQKQPPENNILHSTLQEKFNLSSEDAKEIVAIVGRALDGKYAPSIAAREYNRLLETTENDFLKIRNTLYYAVAQKEMDRLQSELTGSISNDLKCGLKIIVSTIALIHYDLLPSLWNKDIHFKIGGGRPQKNTLPFVLYSYYSTLKQLLDIASKNQDPVQYEANFISKIEPFLEKFREEENSFFTNSLNEHYKWHRLALSVLLDLPKLVHKAKAAQSQDSKEKIQPSAEPVASPPPLAENASEIKIDDEPQPTSLHTPEMNATQSKSSGNSSSSSEKSEIKYEPPSNPEIRDQSSSSSSSSSDFKRLERNQPSAKSVASPPPSEETATQSIGSRSRSSYFQAQETSAPSSASATTSMTAYDPGIFETEEKANKKMLALLLEVTVQRIHQKKGIQSHLFHSHGLSEYEDAQFHNWLVKENIYTDFYTALVEKLSKSLPERIGLSDFKHINIHIINYFRDNPMRRIIAVYSITNNFYIRKYSIMLNADQCIASFCKSFKLDINIFKNHEKIPRLFATEFEGIPSSSNTRTLSIITHPILQEPIELTKDELECEMKEIDACKKAMQKIDAIKMDRAQLNGDIDEFCKENHMTIAVLRDYARKLPQDEIDVSVERGSLKYGIQLVRNIIKLDEEIERYDNAIKAVKTLQYIDAYESMLNEIMRIKGLSIRYTEAEIIVSIYGHGLIKPYLVPINFWQYQEFIEKEENFFSEMKHEIYYKVAEKGFTELQHEPSVPLLRRISLCMHYIVIVIELASYDVGFFIGKAINYNFGAQSQKKYIPSLLHDYREKLLELIKAADSMGDPDAYLKKFNTEVMAFQNKLSELIGESIHYTWHSKLLTNLCVMANFLLEKGKDELPSNPVINDQSSSRQCSLSSSSSSFQSEGRRRNRSSSAPPTRIVENAPSSSGYQP